MKTPREEHEFLRGINNIKKIAYYELYEKYVIQDRRGMNKLTQIESTDQESIIISRNGGYPVPGMIYTFIYDQPEKFMVKDVEKDFVDVVPLVFCMNNDRQNFKGLNLNMLPGDARLNFLEHFYNTFKDFMEREAEALSQNDELAMNKRFISYIKSGRGQNMLNLFNRRTGENFHYAYRQYNVSKVRNLRMVEYNEWVYIPFLEPRDAFRLVNHSTMHKLYRQS